VAVGLFIVIVVVVVGVGFPLHTVVVTVPGIVRLTSVAMATVFLVAIEVPSLKYSQSWRVVVSVGRVTPGMVVLRVEEVRQRPVVVAVCSQRDQVQVRYSQLAYCTIRVLRQW
jgi:hypothetical protein